MTIKFKVVTVIQEANNPKGKDSGFDQEKFMNVVGVEE